MNAITIQGERVFGGVSKPVLSCETEEHWRELVACGEATDDEVAALAAEALTLAQAAGKVGSDRQACRWSRFAADMWCLLATRRFE